jgi:polyisoprenoid-binding protein YceI
LWPNEPTRRHLLALSGGVWLAPLPALATSDQLTIGAMRGTIDFAIGESKVFRTTGSFKDWQGKVKVDDRDIPSSAVDVVVKTASVRMIDEDQTAMLKDADFFDVEKFPEMSFHSTGVERTGEELLKVTGDLTLRGISKPMVLDVSVTDRKPGARYARFRGKGTLKRSQFGMTKFIDVVGDTVEISIRADAWR